MLGFPDKEDMGNENSSQTNSPSYINPFKKENEKPLPPPVPEVAKISQKDVEDAISDEVVDKVTSVLNTSLPEYVRECIDKDAQANYVRSLIGSTLTDFLQQIKQEAEEAARQQWQKDRMDLANKSSEASKQMNEYKTKNEELRNRILSLDRQKTTLNDRISTLENRAASAEAEREQYQLECKSLMNKIKVAAVNDEALQALRQDNDDLRAANESLQNEIAEIKADAERKATDSAAQILAAKADVAKKEARIAELSSQPDDANEKEAEIERLNAELETIKSNAKTEAEALTARITALSQATLELEETKRKLAEAEDEKLALKNAPAASSEELEKLQNELAVRNNELASMRSTIQSQNDELYALHEKLNETGDTAKMAEIEVTRAKLEDTVEKLNNELSQKTIANRRPQQHERRDFFCLRAVEKGIGTQQKALCRQGAGVPPTDCGAERRAGISKKRDFNPKGRKESQEKGSTPCGSAVGNICHRLHNRIFRLADAHTADKRNSNRCRRA